MRRIRRSWHLGRAGGWRRTGRRDQWEKIMSWLLLNKQGPNLSSLFSLRTKKLFGVFKQCNLCLSVTLVFLMICDTVPTFVFLLLWSFLMIYDSVVYFFIYKVSSTEIFTSLGVDMLLHRVKEICAESRTYMFVFLSFCPLHLLVW